VTVGRSLPVLEVLLVPLGPLLLLALLGVHLAAALALLAAGLLGLLAALLTLWREPPGLGVTRLLLGLLVFLLAELLGVAPVLGALVGAAALLTALSGLLVRLFPSRLVLVSSTHGG
jgi:hypothetical protein